MKKTVIGMVMLAASLMAVPVFAAETEKTAVVEESGQNPVMNYVGRYGENRATIDVEAAGDADAKIVKLSDGTVYMQSSGDASVYVTDGGDTEIRSDGGAALIILKSDGDILISGNIKDNRILQATSALPIPSEGSTSTGYITGLTSDHQLVRWNFSSSAENAPPADLDWDTYDGYFTITNNDGTTSESITPVFILPQ